MNRWEYFESGMALVAVKIGVIPIDLLTKYDSYKTYRDILALGHNEAQARAMAAEKCRCHYSSIVRAIYWFERDDPAHTSLTERSWRSRKHLRNAENKKAA